MESDAPRRQRHALGVDFGTSNTVAVARWPDGRARPILIDGSPLLPSAVYAEPDGQLIVGRDAVHSARLDPARFEPNPKRRVDDGTVLLGEHEVPVGDLFTAVLARVAEEWHRAVGPVRPDVTLTCPATWGATRRTLLAEAAAGAGLSGARLVAEPVAAATYFAEVLGRDVPIGSVVVVHDFGAGTFDASVVARTAEGFEVLAVDGRDDIGGLDVDAAIVDHLGRSCAGRDPEGWQRLNHPSTVEQRRAQRQLWDDVRVAKERLSRTQSADLVVPLLDVEVHLTRDELESLAGPLLSQTVQVTQGVLRWVGLAEGRLAGVFLVGGASRIPLVATLLHRALGAAPVVIEQPELVVAEGSILADAALLASGPAAPGLTGEMRLVSGARPPRPARDDTGSAPTVASARPGRAAAGHSTPGRPTGPSAEAGSTVSGPTVVGPMVAGSGVAGSGAMDSRAVGWGGGGFAVDDADTVRGALSGMPPAVDPWPDARDEHWAPDPDHTVMADPSWGQAPTVSRTRSLPLPPPAGREAGAAPAGGEATAVPAGRDATRAESAATSAEPAPARSRFARWMQPVPKPRSSPEADPARTTGPSRESGAAREPGRAQGAEPARGSGLTREAGPTRHSAPDRESGPTREEASNRGRGSARETESAREAGSAREGAFARGRASAAGRDAGAARKSRAGRGSGRAPQPDRDAQPGSAPRSGDASEGRPAARPRRRPGAAVRLLQLLLSLILLLAVPAAAVIVAYGYGNGVPLSEDARRVAVAVARLLGIT